MRHWGFFARHFSAITAMILVFSHLHIQAKTPNSGMPPKSVVVISLDGVGFNQLKKIDPLFLNSKKVCSLEPPERSLTFPGHATLATGTNPESHGVRGNVDSIEVNCSEAPNLFRSMNNPKRLLAKPMWTAAAELGFDVRTQLWPNSIGPWNGVDHHANQTYQTQLNYDEEIVFSEALSFLRNKPTKNRLFMGWHPGLDNEGHRFGPLSDKVKGAWSRLKLKIQNFLIEIETLRKQGQNIQVYFVSDHGMTENPIRQGGGMHGFDPSQNSDMIGISFGSPDQNCPGKMKDFASHVWQDFGLKWVPHVLPPKPKVICEKRDQSPSTILEELKILLRTED